MSEDAAAGVDVAVPCGKGGAVPSGKGGAVACEEADVDYGWKVTQGAVCRLGDASAISRALAASENLTPHALWDCYRGAHGVESNPLMAALIQWAEFHRPYEDNPLEKAFVWLDITV
eukprot:GHVT01041796.1.p1 GENE.GHVT01041796.1~~GHVT01041796.1.p1  ORF type:complete len:131 (-),score=28.27 GHVT01041796.1:342-692(-)